MINLVQTMTFFHNYIIVAFQKTNLDYTYQGLIQINLLVIPHDYWPNT
jgi:hypothetical protein